MQLPKLRHKNPNYPVSYIIVQNSKPWVTNPDYRYLEKLKSQYDSAIMDFKRLAEQCIERELASLHGLKISTIFEKLAELELEIIEVQKYFEQLPNTLDNPLNYLKYRHYYSMVEFSQDGEIFTLSHNTTSYNRSYYPLMELLIALSSNKIADKMICTIDQPINFTVEKNAS